MLWRTMVIFNISGMFDKRVFFYHLFKLFFALEKYDTPSSSPSRGFRVVAEMESA